MSAVKAIDEPCWVRSPDCMANKADPALYFVGQSETPLAHWGRPSRDSIRSAQQDAENQYARYLGVEIESSLFMKELLRDEGYQSQFKQTVKSTVKRTVTDVVKADEYFVAHQQTQDGEPIWTTYILIRVSKEAIQRHRAAALMEAKAKKMAEAEKQTREAAEENARKAAAARAPDQWVASVHNIDDGVSIFVNETKIHECGFSQSCDVKLTPHFVRGKNTVRLEYKNLIGPWTYGYEIHKNDQLMYQGRCGQVWVYGCRYFDTDVGITHRFEFEAYHPKDHRK